MPTDTGHNPPGLHARERALWLVKVQHRGQALRVAVPFCAQGWNARLELDDGLAFYTGPFSIMLDASGALEHEGLERCGTWLLPAGASREGLPEPDEDGLRELTTRLGALCAQVDSGTGMRVAIELTSDCVCQSWLRRLVKGFLAPLELSERDIYRMQLAVDEALTNIIRHAYGEATRRPIDFTMEVHDGLLEVCFFDVGRKPDIANMRFELPDDTHPGGRGLFILNAVFDRVAFDTTGSCTRLRMTRTLGS